MTTCLIQSHFQSEFVQNRDSFKDETIMKLSATVHRHQVADPRLIFQIVIHSIDKENGVGIHGSSNQNYRL